MKLLTQAQAHAVNKAISALAPVGALVFETVIPNQNEYGIRVTSNVEGVLIEQWYTPNIRPEYYADWHAFRRAYELDD